jgi:hypothetical protein
MNEQQLAAVKRALEALEEVAARTGARWALEQGYAGHLEAITALQSIISQDALDKKAENARELGLDYEPAPVQEPLPQCTHNWVNNPKEKWCLRCGAQEADHIAGGGKVMPTAAQPVAWVDIREIDIMAEAKHWRNPEAFVNGAKWAQVELKGKNT